MVEKTYSQKIARMFEIVDYILLPPASFGLFLAVFMVGVSPLIPLLLYAFAGVGFVLLAGYFKHSRGRLADKYVSALWLATAVYNSVLFLPCLYWASTLLQTDTFLDYEGKVDSFGVMLFTFVLGTVFGYLTAIVFALRAFSFERRKKFI
ncbi:MAG TPA: hypothetical protein VIL74_04120 [Pyrinomonadaceae bacterium]|jgi:hypothetical protein